MTSLITHSSPSTVDNQTYNYLLLIHSISILNLLLIYYYLGDSASCYFLLLTGEPTVKTLIFNEIQKLNFTFFLVISLLFPCKSACYSLLFFTISAHLFFITACRLQQKRRTNVRLSTIFKNFKSWIIGRLPSAYFCNISLPSPTRYPVVDITRTKYIPAGSALRSTVKCGPIP